MKELLASLKAYADVIIAELGQIIAKVVGRSVRKSMILTKFGECAFKASLNSLPNFLHSVNVASVERPLIDLQGLYQESQSY